MPGLEGHLGGGIGIACFEVGDQGQMQADRVSPAQAGEAQPLGSAYDGGELVEHATDCAIGGRHDGDVVKLVVGSQRGLGVAGTHRGGEALVGRAHGVEVGAGQQLSGRAHRHLVHRRHHVAGITDMVVDERGHDCGLAGLGLDQAGVGELEQRLAHRGPAHAQLLGQLAVAQLTTRLQPAVDDGVTQPQVDVVA